MKRVVVVGGGFGGLLAVRGLRRADVEVTLVDRQNFHLFQPLAYQVATGALSAAEIASPLRQILRRQPNARVLLAEVTGFDLANRAVSVDYRPSGEHGTLEYDRLVVAGGSAYSYFGHDEWAEYAPELKSLTGALDLRSRILSAFEAAESEDDEEARAAWLTFVVVGGGPTGVEMAGQIAELARDTLHRDYRVADTRSAKVLLVEATDRLLGTFPESLAREAEKSLASLGATTLLGTTVVGVDAHSVEVRTSDGETSRIPARNAIGPPASPPRRSRPARRRVAGETDRAGRLTVEPDLTLPGTPRCSRSATWSPSVTSRSRASPPSRCRRDATSRARSLVTTNTPFRYRDKGNLATIGRSRAIADIKGLHFSGFLAWVLWLGLHLFYLIGFQNRLLVFTRWTFSYVTRGRGARLIHD